MRKSNVLATVSVIALSTAAGFTGANAAGDANLRLTWEPAPLLAIDAGSTAIAAVTNQDNNNTPISATIDVTKITSNAPGLNDFMGGAGNSISVTDNVGTATAIGNIEDTKSISIWTVTGSGATDAGTLGSIQMNRGTTTIDSAISNFEIEAASEDLGLGSSQLVDRNRLTSTTSGNITVNVVEGDLNPAWSSTELGQTQIAQGLNDFLEASAGLLIGSAQVNDGIDATATVTTARIGSLALVNDDTITIDGIPLSVQDNTIEALIVGNDGINTLQLDDDLDVKNASDVVLDGAVGVVNAQLNRQDAMSLTAEVKDVAIEAGDTFGGTEPIDNLTGSTVNFAGNDILADAMGNTATNKARVDGITVNGTFSAGKATDNVGLINAGNEEGHVLAVGDVFVSSLQFTEATVTATIGDGVGALDVNDGDLNVLVEDTTGSSVIGGDTDLLDGVFDGNSIFAAAGGNSVSNRVDVENVTTFNALTTLTSLQNTDGGNQQIASTNGDLTVSVATLGGSDGTIDDTAINADGNRIGSSAITNNGSNNLSIDATTINGPGVDPNETNLGFMTRSWRSNLVSSASTDIALVSSQHVDDSTLSSTTIGSFVVEAADIGGTKGSVTQADVSASGNAAVALIIGNVINENHIDINSDGGGATFDASVGLVSTQVVQNSNDASKIGLNLSATVRPGDDVAGLAIVDMDSNALATSDSQFDADGNSISAQVFGNLVNSDTNAITISGVTVGDNDMGSRTAAGSKALEVSIGAIEAQVDRNIAGDDLPQTTVNSGFSLISDQSFEDSEGNPITATVIGNFVDVAIGSTDAGATLSKVDVSASQNAIEGSVALNTSNNLIDVGAVTLDANSTLVNTQTLWDEEDQFNGSGSVEVSVTGDILVDVQAGATTISDLNAEANSNSILGSARINNSTNAVEISAQTQEVTGIIAGADINSINIGADKSVMRAETGLLNDQDFNGLMGNGLSVLIDDTDIQVTAGTNDGSIENSTVTADANSIKAQSLANEARNSMTLDVGSFDLDDALIGGGAGNAPLGIIGNAQRSSDADQAGAVGVVQAQIQGVDILASVADVDNAADGITLTVDGNDIRSVARVNNGINTLAVSGTTYEEAVAGTPQVKALSGAPGGSVAADDLAFGIASYQINGYDVTAIGQSMSLIADAEGPGTIDASTISVSGNTLLSEARSNEASNAAAVDFVTNNASAFVANVQTPGPGNLVVTASQDGNSLIVRGDPVGTSVTTDSHASVDGNAIAALASSNRATNQLVLDGTNVFSGSGGAAPAATIDPTGAFDVTVASDASILNVQGPAIGGIETEDVIAEVDNTNLSAFFDTVDSGTVSIDNNLLLGQAVIHSATNRLGIGAGYGLDSGGQLVVVDNGNLANLDGASASVISQQVLTDGSSVEVDTEDMTLEANINSIASTDAVAVSISGNNMLGQGIGGSASNRIDIYAGAAITGAVGAPAPVVGDLSATNPLTLNADFNILNFQTGAQAIDVDVEDGSLLIDIESELDGDAAVMNQNVVSGTSTGFSSSNILVLNAGAASDATANVLNRQDINGGTIDTDVNDIDMVIISHNDADTGAVNSSVTINENEVLGSATGNTALNALSTTAGSTLQESSGAGVTIDPAGVRPIVVSDSDYAVLNWQSLDAATVNTDIDNVTIAIDDFSGLTGVVDSALSVNDNIVEATTTGNRAVNSLVLNTGTFQHPSATVANLQTTSGATISSSVNDVSIGIGNTVALGNAVSTGSSFTVRGNQVGSTSIGNSATSSITGN
ncbi:hypothetical protein [Emcibacter sp. SYSU 3D8]|uniref:beta strand repeat-containing protein n=1 Tax=Emcibacter sp. SYSU 3D8 TaxID=3133969 RepID=UPI0031FF23C0